VSGPADAGGRHVLVVGGGVAGITAALDCADAGARVTLVEVRRRLGGAAYSVHREGLHMDNGQHVFLRGCIAYRGLLARLGSTPLTAVQPRLRIPVLRPGHEPYVLRRGGLPAPAHLGWALARYPHLTLRARAGAARAALALMRIDADEPELDGRLLGQWLARHGQDERAIAALWDLIALPTLNLPAAEASLALGVFVFQQGLLTSADAGDIGFHVGTLSQILDAPARAALARAGVDVRLGWGAERIACRESGVEVHGRGDAGTLNGDALVLAVPHARAAGLLSPLIGEQAERWRGLGSSPIVNLHVLFDREVCEHQFAAGVHTPVQYVFDRSAAGGAPPGMQYLAVSLSGARAEMAMSVDELGARYVPAIEALLPRARGARVESFRVTREHAATFSAIPGSAALRPGPETTLPGVVLAGTWTATGWPATLESAVLSGHTAATRVLDGFERGTGAGAGGRREPSTGTGAAAIGAAL
jgi:squalene-associated FAD-dependent desaturase